MCLILFALNSNPEYPLVMMANRDEFYQRPTLLADYWEEDNSILGGRDVQSGGTWLGLQQDGRFIAITNFRDGTKNKKGACSRGELSKSFLKERKSVSEFISELRMEKDLFDGFNILLSDDGFDSLFHYSNISDRCTKIDPGIHGLCNHLLDTPWPKVNLGKESLKEAMIDMPINQERILKIMQDDTMALEQNLPKTGIPSDLEKQLSPIFISMKEYGTRCTSVMMMTKDKQVSFSEISYNGLKKEISKREFSIKLCVPKMP